MAICTRIGISAPLGALFLLASCATPTARNAELGLAKALVSSDQENQIGAQVKSELEQKQRVTYLDDATVVNYVRGVANRVIAVGKNDRNDVEWQVNVIDDPKTVNAFATPGGYLYVYTGLLAAADDEAELAGVMAHETGHVVARHSARNLITAYGLEAISTLADGRNPGLLTALATSIGANGLMLAHSRSDETEADELGARYASAAGYDPHALVDFFHTLEAKQGDTPGVMAYFSDHPATADRITHLEQFIAKNNLGGSQRSKNVFAPMKQRVLAHAPPTPSGAAAAQALSQTRPALPPPPASGLRPASAVSPRANAKPRAALPAPPPPPSKR
jgi:predicted Zn-dependent protease